MWRALGEKCEKSAKGGEAPLEDFGPSLVADVFTQHRKYIATHIF